MNDSEIKKVHKIKFNEELHPEDVIKLFEGKINCNSFNDKPCPFLLIYKGKIPKGFGSVYRYYCKARHPEINGVLPILNIKTQQEANRIIQALQQNLEGTPNIIKNFPEGSNTFIYSCIYTKLLDVCPFDQIKRGEEAGVNEKVKQLYYKWLSQFK